MEKGVDAEGTIPMKTVMKKVQEWLVITEFESRSLQLIFFCFWLLKKKFENSVALTYPTSPIMFLSLLDTNTTSFSQFFCSPFFSLLSFSCIQVSN